MLNPAIHFYKVEYDDRSDSKDQAVINVRIEKLSMDTNQNTNNMDFPVVTYFEHQVPKVVRVLHKITVRVFEHLGITTWKCIDHRWMFIEQVLLIPTIYNSITCH